MGRPKGSKDKKPRTYFCRYHKRKQNIRQEKKTVEELQTVHFGDEIVGNTVKSYLVNLIKIGGEPYCESLNVGITSKQVFESSCLYPPGLAW